MMRADKLLLSSYMGHEAAFLLQDSKLIQMHINTPRSYRIGDIFVGKVKNIVPSIQAAFVQFMDGQTGFLPLQGLKEQSMIHHRSGQPLSCEDELLVQVKKEPVKSKDATLTTDISFQSEHFVLMPFSHGIHYSKMLSADQKAALWELLSEIVETIFGDIHVFLEKYGLIVRTNAVHASKEQLFSQLHDLFHEAGQVLYIADKRAVFSCLFVQASFYEYVVKNTHHIEELSIVADREDVFERMHMLGYENVRLFQEEGIDLFHLYGLGAQIEDALSGKVWLKSGGYLVIEPTEALTVIDVNSGKAARSRETDDFRLKLNLEAAGEIARQLRLRNISGIVVVDFINMEQEEYQKQLVDRLKQHFHGDPVETVLVDITKLGLAEITRKKTTSPLAEQIRLLKEDAAQYSNR